MCITLYCRDRQQHKISDFYGIISMVSDIIVLAVSLFNIFFIHFSADWFLMVVMAS